MTHNIPELLVEVYRGPVIENRHYGHIVATDNTGKVVFSRGNPGYLTYFRSAAKPIQALEVITSGAHAKYNFSEAELSIMCASHYGETYHRNAVKSILHKIGLNENNLQCGPTTSLSETYAFEMALKGYGPHALFNDCSGKHAGFLAICRQKNYPIQTYLTLDHPLQRNLNKRIAQLCQFNEDKIMHGVDGCGVPVHALPIKNMAIGYAALSQPAKLDADTANAARKIVAAMAQHPEMLSGTGGFCTALNHVTKGRLFGKIGAEAVYCVGNTEKKLGLAVKLEDGNLWRLAPIVMKTLMDMQWLSEEEIKALEPYISLPLTNKHNDVVGSIKAC